MQPSCCGVAVHPRQVPFGGRAVLFVHGAPNIPIVFQGRHCPGGDAAEFVYAGHGFIQRVLAHGGVVRKMGAVDAPVHEFIVVWVEVVGLRAVVVALAQFHGLDAPGERGALEGVVKFEFTFGEHSVNTALLPG